MKSKKLWVIAVISNPVRFNSRYSLYQEFEKHVKDAGAELLTVEVAFGDRCHTITNPVNPHHIQLSTYHEIWHKENMINIGISRLPSDWEYVAWIDADVAFTNPNWVRETLHQLQHYMVIQMFSECIDLGPRYEVVQMHKGFAWSHHEKKLKGKAYNFWHPGYAWAARREAIDALGGLIDTAVLGAGDHHMALALVGRAKESIPGGIHSNYAKHILTWEERANKFIKKDLGFLPGTILHYWHGKKADRRYVERWSILLRNKFDPDMDLIRDSQGLYQLSDDKPNLRDEIRYYFRQRNEDSIDV